MLLTYPACVLAFFVTLYVLGLCHVEEVFVPWGLRSILRWGLAPIYGFRRVDATTGGYCTVFYGPGLREAHRGQPGGVTPYQLETIRAHEATHRLQALQEVPGWLPHALGLCVGPAVYGCRYFLEYLRHGYLANRYEVAARHAAGED